MKDPTAEFFDGLARVGPLPMMAATTATIRVDLDSPGNGGPHNGIEHWLLRIDKGDFSVSHADVPADAPADVVLHADKQIFNRIVTGEINPLTAALRGLLGVEGDLRLVVRFGRLMPSAKGPARPLAEVGSHG